MEPVTHFLTGACIGRAGLNRKTAHATVTAVLAAEAADLDVLWGFDGPVEELKHHRGITHTFVGAPFVALAAVGAVGLLYWWSESRRRRKSAAPARKKADGSGAEPGTAPARQRVHWGWLYITALIAALSHILLDWTTSYAVRPFFPFNPRWYTGSFMFIVEPVLWVIFLLALAIPALLGLTDREIGARRVKFRGRGWAVFALSAMAVLFGWRWSEHARGLSLLAENQITTVPVTRVALEPYPVNPFRWHAILETAHFYQTAEVDSHTGQIDSDPQTDMIVKPADTPAVEAAKRTLLGEVYQDWGSWAVIRDVGQLRAPGMDPPRLPVGQTWTTVEFIDLRFDYSFRGAGPPPEPPPLSGWVYIVNDRDDGGESMDGREQK
jgi:inner membrane protein